MARSGFNLSQAIKDYRKAHKGVSCKDALAGVRKANPSEKINEGTFKSTFYKFAGKTRGARRNGQAKANGHHRKMALSLVRDGFTVEQIVTGRKLLNGMERESAIELIGALTANGG